jgi:hypothetical protein
VLLHSQPLSALPAEFDSEFLVIVACDKQRWCDIAWRYAAGIAGAEPIAWCPLPAPDLIPSAVADPLSSGRNPAARCPRRAAACLGRKR